MCWVQHLTSYNSTYLFGIYTFNFVTHGAEKMSRYLCLLFVVFWLSLHEFDDMILHQHEISQMFLENIDPRFGKGGVRDIDLKPHLPLQLSHILSFIFNLLNRKNFPMTLNKCETVQCEFIKLDYL